MKSEGVSHKVFAIQAAPGRKAVTEEHTKGRAIISLVQVVLRDGGLDEDTAAEGQALPGKVSLITLVPGIGREQFRCSQCT